MVCADIDPDRAKETVRQIEAAGGTAVAVGTDVSNEEDVVAMIAAAVEQFGRLDILFNNVGIPTPRLGMTFEDHTVEDFERLIAVNFGGVFLGCKHAVLQFKEQGDGGVILNTGSVAGLVGGVARSTAPPRARSPADQGRRHRGRPVRHPGQRHLPGRHAVHRLHGRRRTASRRGSAGRDRRSSRRAAPAGPPHHRRGLRRGGRLPGVRRGRNITGVLLPVDGGYVAR